MSVPRLLPRLLLALAGGALLAAAFEPVGVAPLGPLGVAVCCVAWTDQSARRGALLGLVAGVAFCFPLMFWMRAVDPLAWLLLSTVEASFLALQGAASAVLLGRRWWPVTVAALWLAVESWRSVWPLSGMPWGRLSYLSVDGPAGALLPWAGSAGVSFLLALVGTVLAWWAIGPARRVAARLLRRRAPEQHRRTPVRLAEGVVPTTVLVAVLGLGQLVGYQPELADPASVAVVQGGVPGDGTDVLLDHQQVTENHVRATRELADEVAAGRAPRPDLVLWPENATAVDPFADETINRLVRSASRAVGVPVLVGAIVDDGPDHVLNQGLVWHPGERVTDRYTKQNPVPFGEYIPGPNELFRSNFDQLRVIGRDMRAGDDPTPVRVPRAGEDLLLADAICFDVAYAGGLYDQVRRGAGMVTVQTSNALFIETAQVDQQFTITRMRARELGRYAAVASINGVTGVVAPDGEVSQRLPLLGTGVLQARVPQAQQVPPSVTVGPVVTAAAVVVSLAGLALPLVPYRRGRGRSSTCAPGRRGP